MPSPQPSEPELTIPRDAIAFIVERAREFDAKEADSDPDSGSNASDDGEADELEDNGDDAVEQELSEFIDGLNVDQQTDLMALAWIGRGTFDISEWDNAKAVARSEHGTGAAQYLLGLPLLGDYLEGGLDAFGEGVVDMNDTREPAGDDAEEKVDDRS